VAVDGHGERRVAAAELVHPSISRTSSNPCLALLSNHFCLLFAIRSVASALILIAWLASMIHSPQTVALSK
jgi:hypothetical protein